MADHEEIKRIQADIRRATLKYSAATRSIVHMFAHMTIPPKDAEMLLLFLAGLSMGMRQASLKDDEVLAALAFGWHFGVGMKDFPE